MNALGTYSAETVCVCVGVCTRLHLLGLGRLLLSGGCCCGGGLLALLVGLLRDGLVQNVYVASVV